MVTREYKPAIVDNFSDFDLGYLVAMIEGEGALMIQSNGRNKAKIPVIYVTSNTDKGIIDHVTEVLSNAGFKAFVVRTVVDTRERRKPLFTVRIKGITYCYPFLKKIESLVKGKKKAIATLMIHYCERRIPKMGLRNSERRYTIEEQQIIAQIKRLNMK